MVDNEKLEFNKLPFLEKTFWHLKNLKFNFDSIAEARKNKYLKKKQRLLNDINKIDVIKIDKDMTYKLLSPKFIKNEDEVYVVVTDHNQLDIGLYKVTISSVYYYVSCMGTIQLQGTINIFENNDKYIFNLSGNEEKLLSNHSYHHVFINKKEAVKFYNEVLQNKIKKIEKLIIDSESPP